MQTIKSTLESLKKFISEKIEEYAIELPALPEEELVQGEVPNSVIPPVVIGTLPHTNFTTYGMDEKYFRAPYILLGVEECSFDDEDEVIPIIIQVCCYAVDNYESTKDDDMKGFYVPDNMAVLDVLLLLENIRNWLIDDSPISTHRPIRIGTYSNKENTYPLAFGYLTFDSVTNEGRAARINFEEL